ncbi:MAG: polyketide biosynthesis enoyl-CoA hydratase PksI [Pseudomonadota bacterium]|nr:polyketide biosynthesis enoyl-CoA hydratase PksI [Pseudomonadota bacterium]
MSEVVRLYYPDPRIAVVVMEDRAHSNLFSRPLVEGLLESFAAIAGNPAIRAVVVHGYDSLFCTGGTQEELLAIVEGRLQFSDLPLYRLFMDCEIPVIAAMQGHALGGGLMIGLFADLVLLAEESLYSANFMKYGFTPGMGATVILPAKLGSALAQEMLLTARGYRGGELRQRGAPFPILKRQDVIPAALDMARDLAEKPLISLKLLKQRLTAELRNALPEGIAAELEMHEVSFAQPEVRQRIETLFGR